MEFDATDPGCWHEAQEMWGQIDWVITNPPFKHAMRILDLAHTYATVRGCAHSEEHLL